MPYLLPVQCGVLSHWMQCPITDVSLCVCMCVLYILPPAVDRSVSASLSDARDAMTNAAIDSLASYRQSVLTIQQPGLLAPACLKLFPLYILALLKQVQLSRFTLFVFFCFLLFLNWKILQQSRHGHCLLFSQIVLHNFFIRCFMYSNRLIWEFKWKKKKKYTNMYNLIKFLFSISFF